jgi:hypothetical protein
MWSDVSHEYGLRGADGGHKDHLVGVRGKPHICRVAILVFIYVLHSSEYMRCFQYYYKFVRVLLRWCTETSRNTLLEHLKSRTLNV